MNHKILITGGAGFIGSVISSYLLDNEYEVVVIDDLSTGNKGALDERATFYQGSILDKSFLTTALAGVDAVIHCAAKSIVEESVQKPELYEQVNYQGTKVLLDVMTQAGINKIIFSSTAAVYGEAKTQPIPENAALSALNPYGQSKIKCEEEIGKKVADGLAAITFRYFNIAGSSKNSLGKLFFRNHENESQLIPKILNKLNKGDKEVTVDVYGDKWQTPDGSCIRDYLHVKDLAHAHLLALNKLTKSEHQIINLGSGKGYSVFEVIDQIDKSVGVKLNRNIYPARSGDPTALLADISKAKEILGWQPKSGLVEIIADSWQGSQQLR
ncbi:UDP-glucose 4-epimerase [Candidatus Nanopelagicus abundans]|uniref:UDP-glucose 4-epimerase n=1 Tax=Candidatus Nanopelagicus abundans TaxID=1884916 RepID=A0A249L5E3_9ACTN|nr:UDP-glucose 4-epimerase GalE [Candidatus Nanopelagicus abundans]ASY24318.1 UDP-glucose 4-epimerase [Candidatus Nanopelagicus abundans]